MTAEQRQGKSDRRLSPAVGEHAVVLLRQAQDRVAELEREICDDCGCRLLKGTHDRGGQDYICLNCTKIALKDERLAQAQDRIAELEVLVDESQTLLQKACEALLHQSKAQDRVRVLEDALRPFVAKFQQHYIRYEQVGSTWFDRMPEHWPTELHTTIGVCRAARAALAPPNNAAGQACSTTGQPETAPTTPAPAAPEGKWVPREPTEAMHAAGARYLDSRMSARTAGMWLAMYNAAPPAAAMPAAPISKEAQAAKQRQIIEDAEGEWNGNP